MATTDSAKRKMVQFLGGSNESLDAFESLKTNEERINFLYHVPIVKDLFKNLQLQDRYERLQWDFSVSISAFKKETF